MSGLSVLDSMLGPSNTEGGGPASVEAHNMQQAARVSPRAACMADSADMAAAAAAAPVPAQVELPHSYQGLHFHLYSSPTSGGVRWRLLGGNNRELGRGLLAYPDVEQCRAGLARTILELPSLVPAVMRVDHRHWGWRLRSGSLDVVGSGHPFDRRPRCEEACARFVQMAPHAVVRDELTVMAYGSRSSRVPKSPARSTRGGAT